MWKRAALQHRSGFKLQSRGWGRGSALTGGTSRPTMRCENEGHPATPNSIKLSPAMTQDRGLRDGHMTDLNASHR